MRNVVCLLAFASLSLAAAEETRLRVVAGYVSARTADDGKVVVELTPRGSMPPIELRPTSEANRQLIKAAKASAAPFWAATECKLRISLDGRPVPQIETLNQPKAPARLQVELHAEGFKFADGRVVPGCGPLAKLLSDLNAPGAPVTVTAQELSVKGGSSALHVTGIKTFPVEGALMYRVTPEPLPQNARLPGMPANDPIWIHELPKERLLAGQDLVLTVRGFGSGTLAGYIRLSDLAIEAPLEGEPCRRLGYCAPLLPAEAREGVTDSLER